MKDLSNPKNPLPDLRPNAPGRPAKEAYRQQFSVVVICPDEAGQRALYEGLKAIGVGKLKVVTT